VLLFAFVVCASAQTYGNTELLQAVNAAIASYKSSGEFTTSVIKWYGDTSVSASDSCASTYPANPTTGGTLAKVIADKQLIVGVNAGAPLHFTQSDGTLVGFDVEMLTYIAQQLSSQYSTTITIDYINVPVFSDVLLGVTNGTYDLGSGGIFKTAARLQVNQFSCNITIGAFSALIKSGGTFATINDLNTAAVTMGVLAGSTQQAYVVANYPGITLISVDTAADAIPLINSGNITGWISSQTTVSYSATTTTGFTHITAFGPVNAVGYGFRFDTTTPTTSSTSDAASLTGVAALVLSAVVALML